MPFIADKTMRASLVDALMKFDNKVYFSYDCEKVYSPVNTHPDIQIHFVDEQAAFVPPELFEYYKSILPEYIDLHKGNKSLGSTYPNDVAYNIARFGQNVILNEKYADDKIKEYYKSKGYNFIDLKQGYTKCNICTDGKVVVTEDAGIYKALIENNIPALKISCADAKLCGFPNGFIGGASGCFENKVFLCGKIKNRDILKKITDFFKENGSILTELDGGVLTDYGSIIYFE